jgi:hypothetical protein
MGGAALQAAPYGRLFGSFSASRGKGTSLEKRVVTRLYGVALRHQQPSDPLLLEPRLEVTQDSFHLNKILYHTVTEVTSV